MNGKEEKTEKAFSLIGCAMKNIMNKINWNLLESRVSEIRLKRIRVNQGVERSKENLITGMGWPRISV